MRPSFHPSPGDLIAQIIPPGEPWPAKAEEYENFGSKPQPTQRPKPRPTIRPQNSDLQNRFEEKPVTKPSNVLDYKPSRPSFHPSPGDKIAQIIPPGEPLPAGPLQNKPEDTFNRYAENYQNYGSVDDGYDISQLYYFTSVSPKAPYPKPDYVWDYKQMRPYYHPRPGNLIAPFIPPGGPWPAYY